MTLAYVVQTVLTYCLWWKPKDVATASFVSLPDMNNEQYQTFEPLSMEATYDVPDPTSTRQSMGIAWYIIPRDCSAMAYRVAKAGTRDVIIREESQIRDDAATPPQEKKDQDAEQRKVTIQSPNLLSTRPQLKRATDLRDLEQAEIPGVKSGGFDLTDNKVVTEWDDALYMTRWWPVVCLLGCSFGAVHLISWNATFPTVIELWLWRASSVGSIATALVTMQFKRVSFRWHSLLEI
ncbi:hypothetical protein GGS24DRAFT_299312 [Hypoxylon argillaceum]|nr:hypothetical protein GGS24DRAFT_299312 [Hypoxylon argillaceum]